MEDKYLTPEEVVKLTCVSKAALAQRRCRGLPPNFYKPTGKIVLYKKSEVADWVERSVATVTLPIMGRSNFE
jgi:predicted DNA-binding transcriptional regulator AlpA